MYYKTYKEGIFDREKIKRAIKRHVPVRFYYTSEGEKNPHLRHIVYPVVLGERDGNRYMRAFIVRGYSYSENGILAGMSLPENRLERWRIYDLSKIKSLKIIRVAPDQIMDLSDFPEYNPDDQFFNKIDMFMKDDVVKPDREPKKEPKREPEKIKYQQEEDVDFTSDQITEPLVPADELKESEEIPEREEEEPVIEPEDLEDEYSVEIEEEEEEFVDFMFWDKNIIIEHTNDSKEFLFKIDENKILINDNIEYSLITKVLKDVINGKQIC